MVDPPAALTRRTIHFSGHVQGVGFRDTTRSVARGFNVRGYVKNLDDGRVRVVVEGAPAEISRFQAAVVDAMRARIAGVDTAESAATGGLSTFEIAF